MDGLIKCILNDRLGVFIPSKEENNKMRLLNNSGMYCALLVSSYLINLRSIENLRETLTSEDELIMIDDCKESIKKNFNYFATEYITTSRLKFVQ